MSESNSIISDPESFLKEIVRLPGEDNFFLKLRDNQVIEFRQLEGPIGCPNSEARLLTDAETAKIVRLSYPRFMHVYKDIGLRPVGAKGRLRFRREDAEKLAPRSSPKGKRGRPKKLLENLIESA